MRSFLEELAKSSGDDPYGSDGWEGADTYAAGNVDDAYEAGRTHAEASIGSGAENILAEFPA